MIERRVLFDVDHTLVRGNLTLYVFAELMCSSWKRFMRGVRFLPYAARLLYQKIPEHVEYALSSKDIHLLDAGMQELFGQFYYALGELIHDFGVTPDDLVARATHLFDEQFIQTFVYESGLKELEWHLRDPRIEVLLISGTAQEILDPFHVAVQRECARRGRAAGQFKALGTGLPTKGQSLDLCMGGGKIAQLIKYCQVPCASLLSISHAYSDNRYLSDLPLLLLAQDNRVVISERHPYYSLLPHEVLSTLTFAPDWRFS